jgi:hypothetical protein
MSSSFEAFIMMAIYRPFGERNGRKCVDNISSLSSISCFWNFTAFGPGVRCIFYSTKNVLLQKFVIQPKRYRQTCTQPMNARGLKCQKCIGDDVGDFKYILQQKVFLVKMTPLIGFIHLIMQEYDFKCLKMYFISLKVINIFLNMFFVPITKVNKGESNTLYTLHTGRDILLGLKNYIKP